MTERTLIERELNRALLARQLLLERSDLSLNKALERIGGLQTQYAPSAYIGLWSRLRDFRRDSLTQALEKRRVVQATMMRVTIHMATVPDYKLFSAGTRKSRRKAWLSYHRRHVGDLDMQAVARSVRKHLADGPRKQAELVALLENDGFPRIAWSGAGLWVDLVRVPPSGTWAKRRADLYGLAEDWIGPCEDDERAGIEHLARRYLSGFGPAPVIDIANWAGLQVTALRPVIAKMKLRRFTDAKGGELVDLPRGPLPDADTPAPVRFLPTWDASLLVHARRTQLLPEEYRPRVFDTKTPHSVPTFLIDGQVAGTWRYEKERMKVSPFGRLSRSARGELDDEADRLAAFHAG